MDNRVANLEEQEQGKSCEKVYYLLSITKVTVNLQMLYAYWNVENENTNH